MFLIAKMDAQFFVKYEARLCQKERISPNGHCVLYGGCTDRYGYGRMKVVIQGREISLTTHRLKYILVNKIKSLNDIGNSDISHLCHNKACLHADHLSLEPHEVNLSRRCCINIGICQHHHPYQDCLLNLRKTYMYILMHIKLVYYQKCWQVAPAYTPGDSRLCGEGHNHSRVVNYTADVDYRGVPSLPPSISSFYPSFRPSFLPDFLHSFHQQERRK